MVPEPRRDIGVMVGHAFVPSVAMLRRVDARDALETWGFDDELAAHADAGEGRLVGRVVTEDRLGYVLQTARGEVRAVLPGKLRRAAATGEALKPAVGDFLVVEDRPGTDGVPVVSVVPRRTKLSRKASGRDAVEQVVAANVDVALLVTSVDADLSPRRLQRYRAICEEGGVAPVVVLTKRDLVDDLAPAIAAVEAAIPGVPIVAVSNVTGEGLDALDGWLVPRRTLALVGSSGVGKSTLVNRWIEARQATGDVRDDGKGRHTTTSRALFRAENGALVIDTPGMRELGLWDADEGVRATFDDVEALAAACRFRDCTHHEEPGCAIRAAIADGTLDPARVASWMQLREELAELEKRRAGRGSADERKAQRVFARTVRARLKAKGR